MLGRTPFFVALMAGAVGLPYFTASPSPPAVNRTALSTAEPSTRPPGQSVAVPPEETAATAPAIHVWAPTPSPPAGTVPATPIVPMSEALNLYITRDWLINRWPRLTTGLSDVELQGYRVPWISGTRLEDVAGSLTYYFTPTGLLARITFEGTTGDPRNLIALVGHRFAFRNQPVSDPTLQLYQVRWNGQAESELGIRTTGIVHSERANTRHRVTLVIKNPALR